MTTTAERKDEQRTMSFDPISSGQPPGGGRIDGEDVLDSVPVLPALQHGESAAMAASHYAPPRRVSIVASNATEPDMRTSSSSAPAVEAPICLRIARSGVPADILAGIHELARHAPRRNILLAEDGPPTVPALGKAHNGYNPVWWWNVV